MQRRGRLHPRRVDIAERDHVVEPILSPIFIAAALSESGRIFERSEKNVPDRQVGKIIRMMPELMIDAMRFGPLER